MHRGWPELSKLMQVEFDGHWLELPPQVRVQAPPGQPVGCPKTDSGMQKPLLGGRQSTSAAQAWPTCGAGPASTTPAQTPIVHWVPVTQEEHCWPKEPQKRLVWLAKGTQMFPEQQPRHVPGPQAMVPPPPP